MKKLHIISLMALAISVASCQNNSKQTTSQAVETNNEQVEVPYTIADRYFVKNTVTKVDNPKIESIDKFEEIFGMATVMGPNGKPTQIDFEKQFVIAVVLPDNDTETEIVPISLTKGKDQQLTFNYKIVTGEKQSYTTSTSLILIVDKINDGPVFLNKVSE